MRRDGWLYGCKKPGGISAIPAGYGLAGLDPGGPSFPNDGQSADGYSPARAFL